MGQTNYTINEYGEIKRDGDSFSSAKESEIRSMNQIACPNCHNRELKILGLKGALAKELALGWLFGAIAHLAVNSKSKNDRSLRPIRCKCKICRHKFEVLPSIAQPEEILSKPCVIRFTRLSSFNGMAVSCCVWLNGVKVANIDNGKTITFETFVRHNIIFVTNQYGVAFQGDYRFDAENNGTREIRFKRKFLQ